MGNPCAAPGQRPQRGLVSESVRVSAQELSGSRCGRNRPLWWEAENAQHSQRGQETSSRTYPGVS
uniref:Uncharacterized protein n=1 Tax=mine drainage metagenome TaxID=410659 RepID=E6PZU4_9ZZZZ